MITGTNRCNLQRLGRTATLVLVALWAVLDWPANPAHGQDPAWSRPMAEIWYRGKWVNQPKEAESLPTAPLPQASTRIESMPATVPPRHAAPPPISASPPNPLRQDGDAGAWPHTGGPPAGAPPFPTFTPAWPQAAGAAGRGGQAFAEFAERRGGFAPVAAPRSESGTGAVSASPAVERDPWWLDVEAPLALVVIQLFSLVVTVVVIVAALARFGKRLPSVLQIELVNSRELGEQLGWQQLRSPRPRDEPGDPPRRAATPDAPCEPQLPAGTASASAGPLPPAPAPTYAERRVAEEKRRQERSQSLVKALFEQNLRLQEEMENVRKAV